MDEKHWCVNKDGSYACCGLESNVTDCMGLEILKDQESGETKMGVFPLTATAITSEVINKTSQGGRDIVTEIVHEVRFSAFFSVQLQKSEQINN